MRLGVIGKGGSGKTTLSAALALSAATTTPVLAIDADINQTLGPLLSFDPVAIIAQTPLHFKSDILKLLAGVEQAALSLMMHLLQHRQCLARIQPGFGSRAQKPFLLEGFDLSHRQRLTPIRLTSGEQSDNKFA